MTKVYDIFRRFWSTSGPSDPFVGIGDYRFGVEIESDKCDPIVRYDVDDDVDGEHYPDGRHWRFPDRTQGMYSIGSDTIAKLIVVKDGKVSAVTDFYEDQNGIVFLAERKR